jgi:peroxiredoxin
VSCRYRKTRTTRLSSVFVGALVLSLAGGGLENGGSAASGAQAATDTGDSPLAALEAAYAAEREQFQERISRATTEADRLQILRDMQSRQADFNQRFLRVAQQSPDSPQSLAALTWILKNDFVKSPDSRAALKLVAQHHLDDADLSEICERLVKWAPSPEAEAFLRSAADSSSRRTQAAARVAWARSLAVDPNRKSEVESLLEELAAEYSDVPSARGSVADAAKGELFELRHLNVGQRAPEISGMDLQGEPLSLSDYRGRVVLLYFWGSWCPHCRQNAPRIEQLTERLRGQPFAIVGVDSDPDAAAANAFLAEQNMDWKSWHDGDAARGPIASRWNVLQWPTTYLLDHQGVIRAKFQGQFPEQLDQAVDQLVSHAPARTVGKEVWPWLLGGGVLCVVAALFRFWRQQVPGAAKLPSSARE